MERFLVMVLVAVAFAVLSADESSYPSGYPDKCLDDIFHKPVPTEETGTFPACGQYKPNGCCSPQRVNQLAVNGTPGMAFVVRNCGGNISQSCRDYLLEQGCFYHCEPMLQKYELTNKPGFFENAPICGSYCEAWFNACKDDLTCVGDWNAAFYSGAGQPQAECTQQQCVTFEQMYGNSTGLCNTIVGKEYVYEASNENCMVMKFSGENPNVNGNSNTSGATQVTAQTAALGLICLLVMFLQ